MSVLYWTCMLERWMREEKGETWAIEWRDRRANSPGLLLARLFFFLQKNEVKGGLMNWGQRGGRPDASRKYVCPVSRCWQREQRWGGRAAALWECHTLGRSCLYPSINLSFCSRAVALSPRLCCYGCSGAGRLLRGFAMLRLQKRNFCTALQLFLQTWPIAVGKILLLHS